MYLRFVISHLDDQSNVRQGVFQAAAGLRDSGKLTEHEEMELVSVIKWFNENLEGPTSLRRSRRHHALNKAISWFKPEAKEHIRRMYHLVSILERNDISVDVVKSKRLGYVVYQDAHQIVAEPYRETNT